MFDNKQSEGLFSNNNSNTLGGGLFGNNNKQNQGGSLFSNDNSNTNIFKSCNITSLFQNNNSFFNYNANQSNTPSLFNNNNQTLNSFGNNKFRDFSLGFKFNGNKI